MNRVSKIALLGAALCALCLLPPCRAAAKDGSVIPAEGYDTTLGTDPLMDSGWLQKQIVLSFRGQTFSIPIAQLADMPMTLVNQNGVAAGSFTDLALLRSQIATINSQLALIPSDGTETVYDRASGACLPAQPGTVCQIRQEFAEQLGSALAMQLLGDVAPADIQIDLNAGFLVAFPAGQVPIIAGSCTTSLSGSSSNRINNVTVAAGKLNGMVILPGQTVSISEAIKPRTKENGYKEAGAYLDGRTVSQVGGGICQVSSTTYNAVITSGLTVLERHPHSMPVHYLPLGLDAAISSGSKDMVFRNDYDLPVTLQAGVSGKKLTVSVILNASLLDGKSYKLWSTVPSHNTAKTYLSVYDAAGNEIEQRFLGTSRYADPKPKEESGAEDE